MRRISIGLFVGLVCQLPVFANPTPTELIQALGDDDWANRQNAQEQLITYGVDILPELNQALSDASDEEVRTRLQVILKHLDEMPYDLRNYFGFTLGYREVKSEISNRVQFNIIALEPGKAFAEMKIPISGPSKEPPWDYIYTILESIKIKDPKTSPPDTEYFESFEWPKINMAIFREAAKNNGKVTLGLVRNYICGTGYSYVYFDKTFTIPEELMAIWKKAHPEND